MLQLLLSFALALALISYYILYSLEQPNARSMELLKLFDITKPKLAKISWVSFFTFAAGCLLLLAYSI